MVQLRRKSNTHFRMLDILVTSFDCFVRIFQNTMDGVHYYESWTPQQEIDAHIDAAKGVLESLRRIRKTDYGAYKAIVWLYKNDIKEAVKVYRESKN